MFFNLSVILSTLLLVGAAHAQELPGCIPPNFQVPDDYMLPHTAARDLPDPAFDPQTVVVAGGSTGIGRQLACYFADLGARVFSFATTDEFDPKVECANSERIKHIKYDVSNPKGNNLEEQLKKYDFETIDLLLLNAGRDALGSMRDWSFNDLTKAFQNNVFGLHEVWRKVRKSLNPEGAVVLGVSSVSAESYLFARRGVYRTTKHALADFMLTYAYEEGIEQLNTSYGVIYQGDAGSNFGLKRLQPKFLSEECKESFEDYGQVTNQFLNMNGMILEDVTLAYHKIYSFLQYQRYNCPDEGGTDPLCVPAAPQTFSVEAVNTIIPLRTLEFNHRLVPPEFVYLCYGPVWQSFQDAYPFLDPGLLDPREQLVCDAKQEH